MSDYRNMAAGGVQARGRFFGRIREVERDAAGNLIFDYNPETGLNDLPRLGRVVEDNIVLNNGAVTVGLNSLLDVGFRAQTQITAWYCSLINNAGFSALSAGDTASSHAGWVEWQGYNEANRVTWSPAAAASGSISNSSAMTFTNNSGGSISIRGVFVISSQAKGATTGTLWATAIEGSARTLSNGQAFQVVYQIDLTPTS